MDKETFRKFGHEFVNWVVDYLDSVEEYPVRAQVGSGEILDRLPEAPLGMGSPWNISSRIFRRSSFRK
ncbi:MAG: hypothetical protein PVI66_03255 [Candidatus Aminicenantes bacterium]|jgi:aromatic-L-amino-acid decarboxylase